MITKEKVLAMEIPVSCTQARIRDMLHQLNNALKWKILTIDEAEAWATGQAVLRPVIRVQKWIKDRRKWTPTSFEEVWLLVKNTRLKERKIFRRYSDEDKAFQFKLSCGLGYGKFLHINWTDPDVNELLHMMTAEYNSLDRQHFEAVLEAMDEIKTLIDQ